MFGDEGGNRFRTRRVEVATEGRLNHSKDEDWQITYSRIADAVSHHNERAKALVDVVS